MTAQLASCLDLLGRGFCPADLFEPREPRDPITMIDPEGFRHLVDPEGRVHAMKVICASCGTAHHPALPSALDYEQCNSGLGDGCAAWVSDNCVIGGYGSCRIDMEKWVFTDRPAWVRDGNLCDACIDRLMAEARLRLTRRGFW
jgi:hypothetical protein